MVCLPSWRIARRTLLSGRHHVPKTHARASDVWEMRVASTDFP
jgi:hypothetical protein